jgi:hypothetical protein
MPPRGARAFAVWTVEPGHIRAAVVARFVTEAVTPR